MAASSQTLYCLTHNCKQLQVLDATTLALKPNGIVSLEQELIEYAYDHDAQAFEIGKVVTLQSVENSFLALVTEDGYCILI